VLSLMFRRPGRSPAWDLTYQGRTDLVEHHADKVGNGPLGRHSRWNNGREAYKEITTLTVF